MKTDHYHRSNMYKAGYWMGRQVGRVEAEGSGLVIAVIFGLVVGVLIGMVLAK